MPCAPIALEALRAHVDAVESAPAVRGSRSTPRMAAKIEATRRILRPHFGAP